MTFDEKTLRSVIEEVLKEMGGSSAPAVFVFPSASMILP